MPLIALFGATGRTGQEFIQVATQCGCSIKALVRDPAKVTLKHEHLTLIPGDFDNLEAIETALHGAEHVVVMAAAALNEDGVYPKDFMLNFVKRLYSIMLKSPPKVFLFQAGSMSSDGNGFLHPGAWTMKQTLGRKLKILDKIEDNNAAIRYIAEHGSSVSFIVTRAGVLKEGPPSGTKIHLSHWPPNPLFPITFGDLAACTHAALQDESGYNSFPFVRP